MFILGAQRRAQFKPRCSVSGGWGAPNDHVLLSPIYLPRAPLVFRRPTFCDLIVSLYGTTSMRPPLSGHGPHFNPCERTAMALFRLGHGAGVRATAILFDVSEGMVVKHTMSVVHLVIKKLQHVLQWPTVQEQENISRSFQERTGFK